MEIIAAMGFPKSVVKAVLEDTKGDAEAAVGILLNVSYESSLLGLVSTRLCHCGGSLYSAD